MATGRMRYWALALLLFGGAIYFADYERLQLRYFEYKASEEALEAARAEVIEIQATVVAAQERLKNFDDDPTNIEANVRQIKHRIQPDEMLFRVEFVPDADDNPTGTAAGLHAVPTESGVDAVTPELVVEHKDTGPN